MSHLESNTSSKPRLVDRLKSWTQLMGKYGLSSLVATGLDFLAFQLGLSWLAISAVQATVLGRCAGGVASFWMQRKWVFRAVHATNRAALLVKYGSGILLGMGLNVVGVWLLHDLGHWAPWPSRIASATAGWFLIFLFNHRIVFHPASNRQPFNYRT